MAAEKSNQFWILITVLLIAVIVIGGIIAWAGKRLTTPWVNREPVYP